VKSLGELSRKRNTPLNITNQMSQRLHYIKSKSGPKTLMTDTGRIDINVCVNHSGEMLISVSDTGIGISEQDLPNVLKEFSRVEDQSTKSIEGTGLGLPLTKMLVELHGGRFSIESTLGEGTTVLSYFPASRVIEQAA
jgi:signal transduction histidine kinase